MIENEAAARPAVYLFVLEKITKILFKTAKARNVASHLLIYFNIQFFAT